MSSIVMSVVAAWSRELQPDMDRVNVNGGEIGFVTMCCGGGLGTGTLIQRL